MFRKWEKEGVAPQQIGNAGQGCSAGAYTCRLGTAFFYCVMTYAIPAAVATQVSATAHGTADGEVGPPSRALRLERSWAVENIFFGPAFGRAMDP